MADTRLDKIFFELQGITANQKRILELLSERSKEIAKAEITNTITEEITGTTFAVPIGKGKYQWYRLSNNEGKGFYVQDTCDFYGG